MQWKLHLCTNNNAFCIPNAFHASAVPQFMRNMPLYTSFAYHPLYSIVSSWTKINFLCNFLFHFDIDIFNLHHSCFANTMKKFTEKCNIDDHASVYGLNLIKRRRKKDESEISFWCFDFWREHKSFLLVQGSSSMALPGFCLKNQDCVCC